MTVKELKEMLNTVDENFDIAFAFQDFNHYKDETYRRYLCIEAELTVNFEQEVIYIQGYNQ